MTAMKISIGMRLTDDAWGGGNRFGRSLTDDLAHRGCRVTHDLKDDDLDIILLAEPDARLRVSAYDHHDILRYLLFRNRRCLVVHRINNTSEARQDAARTFNRFRIAANRVADHTVFVSAWVRDRYRESGFPDRPGTVILNGVDRRLWRPGGAPTRDGKVRIVTHHWSNNPNKGFDIYARLDRMLRSPEWSERIDFTYIGRVPEGFRFENARHLEPMNGQDLVDELCRHTLYLTASRHESGGNHNLEGGMCGLPLLYIESGSMAEYCSGFGIGFTPDTFEEKLAAMIASRAAWAARMADFPHTSERMCAAYHALFQALLRDREAVIARRRWWRRPWWVMQSLRRRE